MVGQQNWQQFSPDSPSYLGAQGIGIPPWMQNQFGGGADGGGAASGGGAGASYDPNQSAALRGSAKFGAANGNANIKPQWFQDFESRQNQMNYAASTPAPVNPAQPPATSTPPAPTTQPDMAAAPVVPPAAPPQDQGIGLPSVPSMSADVTPPPAVPSQNAPAPQPPPQSAPSPTQSAAAVQTSNYQPGQGAAVSNGWFHDSNPTGGTYAGESNGQPIYYHYGNQSAQDQYNSQYPGQASATPAPAPTPVAPTNTPTPSPSPSPGANSIAPNASTTPEALGGTQSTPDWVSNQQQLAAGFGSDVPAALGGTRAYARGGAVRGYAHGGEVDMDGHMGLVHAARQLQSHSQGPDTTLAHISPDESAMLDYLQGGRRTNHETGLPQYSLFGDILKAVARVAATTVGFMYGGPLGAAAGSAAATKLTGGSWKDAAISGGLSGLTAGIGNVAGGNSLLASGNSLAGSAASGVNGMSDAAIAAGAPATGAAGSSLGQTLAQGVKYLGTAPGLSLAATSGLGAFNHSGGASTPPPGWQGPGTQLPNTYDPKNLPGWYAGKASAQKTLDAPPEGGVGEDVTLDPNDPNYAGKMSLRYAGAPAMAGGGPVGLGAPPQALLQAADWGYVNAKGGGSIHGPGGPTDDEVPALLSNQEHVIDAQTIGDLAKISGHPGDYDAGQDGMEKIKQTIRRAAGRKNPKSPTSPMKAA